MKKTLITSAVLATMALTGCGGGGGGGNEETVSTPKPSVYEWKYFSNDEGRASRVKYNKETGAMFEGVAKGFESDLYDEDANFIEEEQPLDGFYHTSPAYSALYVIDSNSGDYKTGAILRKRLHRESYAGHEHETYIGAQSGHKTMAKLEVNNNSYESVFEEASFYDETFYLVIGDEQYQDFLTPDYAKTPSGDEVLPTIKCTFKYDLANSHYNDGTCKYGSGATRETISFNVDQLSSLTDFSEYDDSANTEPARVRLFEAQRLIGQQYL